jgi:hypothetical protein
MDTDRTEISNLAASYPQVVKELNDLYFAWADRCNVMPLDQLLELRKQRRERNAASQ